MSRGREIADAVKARARLLGLVVTPGEAAKMAAIDRDPTPLTGRVLQGALKFYEIQLEGHRWNDARPCEACVVWERKIFGRVLWASTPAPIRAACRQCEWLIATWHAALVFTASDLTADLANYRAAAGDAKRRSDSGPRTLLAAVARHVHNGVALKKADFYGRLAGYAADADEPEVFESGAWRWSNVREYGEHWAVDVPGEGTVKVDAADLERARAAEAGRLRKKPRD